MERSELLKTPETCGGCHGEKYSTYRDTFHGKASHLGFVTGAICSDCHTPHRQLPADDPRSSVSPANLGSTCGHCHGEVPPQFAAIAPHVDPSDPDHLPPVHWIWLGMNGLLIAVFGLFGLHDLLWLQRAIVGWRRGEFPARPIATGPHVRRFSKADVRVHVVVVVTFLLLAATGLPLKYSSTAWATTLMELPGGIELTRFLHRLAAVVTFGYACFHVGRLAYRAIVRREAGLFWGWGSMVPRGKDLADLWNNLRYFLYLAPRPRFARLGDQRRAHRAQRRGAPRRGLHLRLPLLPHAPAARELPARSRDLHGRDATGPLQGGAARRVRASRRLGTARGTPHAAAVGGTPTESRDFRILGGRDRIDPGGRDLLGPGGPLRILDLSASPSAGSGCGR